MQCLYILSQKYLNVKGSHSFSGSKVVYAHVEDRNIFKLLFLFLHPYTLLILFSPFHIWWPSSQILPLKLYSHKLYGKSPSKSVITTTFKSARQPSSGALCQLPVQKRLPRWVDCLIHHRNGVCLCVCACVCVSDTSEGGFEEEPETLKPHHMPSSFCKNLSIFGISTQLMGIFLFSSS